MQYMPKILWVWTLCLLLVGTTAEWKKLGDISALSFDYGAYTASSGTIHFAYCKYINNAPSASLVYIRMYSNRTLSSELILHQSDDCRSATMQGSPNSQSLYIASSNTRLCAGSAYACANILFTESKDAGATWSKPTVIHPQTTDPSFRYNPQVLVNPHTERLWVIFKAKGKEDPTELQLVSRPPGSQVFSLPTKIALIKRASMVPGGLSVALRNEDGNYWLHVAWQDRNFSTEYQQDVQYIRSADNGITWTAPTSIVSTNLLDSVSPFTLATVNQGIIFIVYSRTDKEGKDVWLRISRDSGKSWLAETSLDNKEEHLATYAKICYNNGIAKTYVLLQDQLLSRSKNAFGVWDHQSGNFEWKGNPYGDVVSDCVAPHVVCAEKNVLQLCKNDTHQPNHALLYQLA